MHGIAVFSESPAAAPARPTRLALKRLQSLLATRLLGNHDQEGLTPYLKAIALVAAISGLGALVDLRAAPSNLAMLYLLGAVFLSYRCGIVPALTYSIISTITFDFFFIPPYRSFAVTDFWY